MAGAIPTLSRGGSWLPTSPAPGIPDTSFSTPSQARNQAATGPSAVTGSGPWTGTAPWTNPLLFPRTEFTFRPTLPALSLVQSRLANPAPPRQRGPASPSESFFGSHGSQKRSPTAPDSPLSPLRQSHRSYPGSSASITGSVTPNTDPVRYEGWANSESMEPVRYAASNARSVTAGHARSVVTSLSSPGSIVPYQESIGGRSEGMFRRGDRPLEGGSWEKGSGAPKPISREQAYLRPGQEGFKSPYRPIRPPAESLPSPPPYSDIHGGDADIEAEGGRGGGVGGDRPRRHSYERFMAEKISGQRGKARSRVTFDGQTRIDVDRHHRLREEGIHPAPKPASPISSESTIKHSSFGTVIKAQHDSKSVKQTRPSVSRRHTQDATESPPPSLPTIYARSSTNYYPSSTRSDHPASTIETSSNTHHPRRRRHVSTPHRKRNPEPSDTFGFTSSSSGSSTIDLSPLDEALPATQAPLAVSTRPPPSSRTLASIRTKSDAPPGYISPLEDEPYDRYSTHPAAPAPDRVDRAVGQAVDTIPAVMSVSPVHPRTDTQFVENSGAQSYLPVGYARPTKDFPWNRDGPAMKTYGVAWQRDAGGALPDAPEGPRWVQARPPRAQVVQGGGWWESGGQGV